MPGAPASASARVGGWLSDQPYLLLSLTSLFWAGNTVLGRFVVGHIPPMALAFGRWAGAFLILLPFAAGHLARDWPVIRKNAALMVLLALVGFVSLAWRRPRGAVLAAAVVVAPLAGLILAINLKSVFWVTKHGIPHLQKAGGGSIILVGSVSALAGFTRAQDAYTAAKGALISLNKSLAIQFARDNIRSNIIHPGIVETPLQAPYLNDALRAEFKTGIPLGRIGQPRDIANAALFLASDESSFMTGAEMIIDGGFMAQ